jgi:hypothetical protein
LEHEYPYLSVIDALMYLVNNTRPDIAFAVNYLVKHSTTPTMRHWNVIKNISRYLHGTIDLGLLFRKNQDHSLIGSANAGYLCAPQNTKSQTRYMSLHRGTAISWKAPKQTLVATSTNHSEIIALDEASQECTWLSRMIDHILISCGIDAIGSPTIIYEDNSACIAQMQMEYVKTNYMKYISLKLFYPHQLQESGESSILQTKSCDNYTDLFTKSLPLATFDKCVKYMGMRILKDLHGSGGEIL